MIIARYILKEYITPLLMGIGLFTLVLMLDKLFDLVDLFINKGVAFGIIVKLFTLFLPTVISLTVPMAVLLAALLAFGHLSETNEFTAMRAAGLSFMQFIWPPVLLAFVISLILIPFNLTVAPMSTKAFRTLYQKILSSDPLVKVEARRFMRIQRIKMYPFEVIGKDRLKGVVLYQTLEEGLQQRIFANEGKVDVTGESFNMDLYDGQIERINFANPKGTMHIRFNDYRISIPLNTELYEGKSNIREKTGKELLQMIKNAKKQRAKYSVLAAEYNLRIAIAFAPIAFCLIGIPLGVTVKRGGKAVGFSIALVVIFTYYLMLIFGLSFAEKGKFPAPPALWAANTVSALLGVYLFWRKNKR